MGKVEERIADFIVNTRPGDIPAGALKAAQRSVFDGIGCMLATSVEPHGKTVTGFAHAEGGAGPASVIGSAISTSRTLAALANGTLSHGLDFDDGRTASGHAVGVLLPAVLALGEPRGASGRELLDAYAIGLEVITHISDACDFEQKESGFHRTSLFGALASTVAAARIAGLDVEQTQMALGTAGATASGLCQSFGTYTKPLHSGMAAKNGVSAVLLAEQGWTGSPDILRGPAGWAAAFIKTFHYDRMADRLGSEWRTEERHPLIKEFPCCGLNHGPVGSLLALIREHGIEADQVAQVEVSAPYDSMVLMYPHPKSGFEGKFSLVYTIASTLLDGKLDHESFSEASFSRPEYAETAKKVRINVSSRWEGTTRGERRVKSDDRAPVVLHLKDGRTLSRSSARVKGLETEEAIAAKFRVNAARALSTEGVEAATAAWSDLARVADISEAVRTVVAAAGDGQRAA